VPVTIASGGGHVWCWHVGHACPDVTKRNGSLKAGVCLSMSAVLYIICVDLANPMLSGKSLILLASLQHKTFRCAWFFLRPYRTKPFDVRLLTSDPVALEGLSRKHCSGNYVSCHVALLYCAHFLAPGSCRSTHRRAFIVVWRLWKRLGRWDYQSQAHHFEFLLFPHTSLTSVDSHVWISRRKKQSFFDDMFIIRNVKSPGWNS
jgi:hypothetical protein